MANVPRDLAMGVACVDRMVHRGGRRYATAGKVSATGIGDADAPQPGVDVLAPSGPGDGPVAVGVQAGGEG